MGCSWVNQVKCPKKLARYCWISAVIGSVSIWRARCHFYPQSAESDTHTHTHTHTHTLHPSLHSALPHSCCKERILQATLSDSDLHLVTAVSVCVCVCVWV